MIHDKVTGQRIGEAHLIQLIQLDASTTLALPKTTASSPPTDQMVEDHASQRSSDQRSVKVAPIRNEGRVPNATVLRSATGNSQCELLGEVCNNRVLGKQRLPGLVTSTLGSNERKNYTKNENSEHYEKKSYKYYDVCNNCGKQGHTFKQCKNPITSFGVIVFRINHLQQREYLMIRRKDTLGYIDFMRGKYSASNQKYIFNMIQQMTIQEKYKLKNYSFDELWRDLWLEGHKIDITHLSDVSATFTESSLSPLQASLAPDLVVLGGRSPLCGGFQPPDQSHSSFRKTSLPHFCDAEDELVVLGGGNKEHMPPDENFIEDTIFQSYKQEEMNSRDKFIYLTTKNIKDISHQSNLSPYISVRAFGQGAESLQQLTSKGASHPEKFGQRAFTPSPNTTKYIDDQEVEDHASQRSSDRRSSEEFEGLRSPDEYEEVLTEDPNVDVRRTVALGDDAVVGEARVVEASDCQSSTTKNQSWKLRKDNGMISILHYLIELDESSYASEPPAVVQGCERSSLTSKDAVDISNMDVVAEKRNMSNIMKSAWTEPEWGFPKGRRNFQEKDYDCALREMTEETGYPIKLMKNIKNILPFDEIFLGSNYKSYKHRYYLMYMNYEDSLVTDRFDKSEVSMMRWKTYDECLLSIRPYNLEKKRLIKNIDTTLSNYIGTYDFSAVGEKTQ